MEKRSGEKAGWTLGWIGSFLWVAILAVVFFIQGKTVEGLLGLALAAIGVLFVFLFAPWRHPGKAYGLLMIPLYLAFLAAIPWAVHAFGGWAGSGLKWWNLLILFPTLTPLVILGARKWVDGEKTSGAR